MVGFPSRKCSIWDNRDTPGTGEELKKLNWQVWCWHILYKSILLLYSMLLLTDIRTKEKHAQGNSLSWTSPKWTPSRDLQWKQWISPFVQEGNLQLQVCETLNHHPYSLQPCSQFKDHEDFFFLLSVPAPRGRSQHLLRSEVCTAASPSGSCGGLISPYTFGRGALFTIYSPAVHS